MSRAQDTSCKICSSAVRTIYDQQYDHNYYYCDNCEFISLDESKIIPAPEEKRKYLFHENNLENEGYVNMFREFIDKAVSPYRTQIKTALDFGAGPGPVLSSLLEEQGIQTDIYDKYFSPDPAYLNKKYDLITATEVFEHLKDPLPTMQQLKPCLNKNGILAVMTMFHPNSDAQFKDWWYRRDATHISFYTPRTFERMAGLLGMKVLLVDNKNICVLG